MPAPPPSDKGEASPLYENSRPKFPGDHTQLFFLVAPSEQSTPLRPLQILLLVGTSCPTVPDPESILLRTKDAGLRRTRALTELIHTLCEQDRPMTLGELADSSRLRDLCDKATVFRLLQKLTDKGLVRRLGLHERAAYFALLVPGQHRDYLICTDCGTISPVQAPCPVHELEEEIRQKTGFKNLYHELEFFGTCPSCA
ncbi:MAG: Fur family transcriptional regulator [Verrucomicrobiales bacterium]